jgi:phosphatidylglycerol:prolipoprotein diacylglycerol transferase
MQPLIPYFQTIQFRIPVPDFISTSPIIVYGFGLCVGIGVVLGAQVVKHRLARLGLLNDRIFAEIVAAVIFGVVVGGHVGYGLFYHPQEYLANPRLFLDMSAGLSSFGGFITATLAILWVLRRHKQAIWPWADSIAIGFSLGWFFGRTGCTINHEHPGTPTHFFLGRFCRPVEGWTIEWPAWMTPQQYDLRFPPCDITGDIVQSYANTVPVDYAGVVAVHDMGLYEALYAIMLFALYKMLDKKPRFDGFFAMLLVFTYAPVRFAMDFLRPLADNPRYGGLTPAQWGCIVFVAASIWGMRYLKTRTVQTRTAAGQQPQRQK